MAAGAIADLATRAVRRDDAHGVDQVLLDATLYLTGMPDGTRVWCGVLMPGGWRHAWGETLEHMTDFLHEVERTAGTIDKTREIVAGLLPAHAREACE